MSIMSFPIEIWYVRNLQEISLYDKPNDFDCCSYCKTTAAWAILSRNHNPNPALSWVHKGPGQVIRLGMAEST